MLIIYWPAIKFTHEGHHLLLDSLWIWGNEFKLDLFFIQQLARFSNILSGFFLVPCEYPYFYSTIHHELDDFRYILLESVFDRSWAN
jgi:hypothetical protein